MARTSAGVALRRLRGLGSQQGWVARGSSRGIEPSEVQVWSQLWLSKAQMLGLSALVLASTSGRVASATGFEPSGQSEIAHAPIEISWRAEPPVGCPRSSYFEARVRRWSIGTALQAQLEIEIAVDPEGYRGRLQLDIARRDRPMRPRHRNQELVERDCAALLDALALIAVMAIDPAARESAATPSTPAGADQPGPTPAQVPKPPGVSPSVYGSTPTPASSEAESASEPPSRSPTQATALDAHADHARSRRGSIAARPVEWSWQLSLGATSGLLVQPCPQTGFAMAARGRGWAVRTRVSAAGPAIVSSAVDDGPRILGFNLAVAVDLCGSMARGRWVGLACAEVTGAPVIARALGVTRAYTRATWAWSSGARLVTRWGFGHRSFVALESGLAGVLRRPSFRVIPGPLEWRSRALTWSASVALGASFGRRESR